MEGRNKTRKAPASGVVEKAYTKLLIRNVGLSGIARNRRGRIVKLMDEVGTLRTVLYVMTFVYVASSVLGAILYWCAK